MSTQELVDYVVSLQADIINPGLQAMIDSGDFDQDAPWTLQSDSLQGDWASPFCEPGYLLENIHYCVPCPKGYYLSGGTCQECPVGQYTSESGSVACTSCPSGHSTRFPASKSLEDCTKMCSPGSYSPDTFEVCASCPVGYFQNETGQTTCVKCPVGKTTTTEGSTAESDCYDFDVLLDNTNGYVEIGEVAALKDLTLVFWMRAATDSVPNVLIDINNALVVSVSATTRVYTPTSSFDEIIDPASSEAWTHVAVCWDTTVGTMSVYLNGQLIKQSVVSPASNPIVQNGHVKVSSDGDSDLYLSGLRLWDGIVNTTDVGDIMKACHSQSSSDVINMDAFSEQNEAGFTLIAPSICDAVDECKSSPCGPHKCYNEAGGYRCSCYSGWTGSTCSTPPNYCAANDCANNATCVASSTNYTCQCQPGYSGALCNEGPVDGELSAWSTWYECSATCGTGTRSRVRTCDSPVPQIHGSECAGELIETGSCNTDACPVCSPLSGDTTTGYQCTTDVTSGVQSCSVVCNDGYILPRGLGTNVYRCGLETGYAWVPMTPLSTCVAPVIPSNVRLKAEVTYNSAVQTKHTSDIMAGVLNNMATTDCNTPPACQIEVVISTPRTRSMLTMKSSIALGDTSDPAFEQYITNGQASSSLQAYIDATSKLESTVDFINNSVSSFFDVTTSGLTYYVDPASLTMCVNIQCEQGHVATNGLCAVCPRGSYKRGDQCDLCGTGSYQDLEGQTACTSCSAGTTTGTIGATSPLQCSASTHATDRPESLEDSGISNTLLYLLVGVGIIIILAGIICGLVFRWYFKRNKKQPDYLRQEGKRCADDFQNKNSRCFGSHFMRHGPFNIPTISPPPTNATQWSNECLTGSASVPKDRHRPEKDDVIAVRQDTAARFPGLDEFSGNQKLTSLANLHAVDDINLEIDSGGILKYENKLFTNRYPTRHPESGKSQNHAFLGQDKTECSETCCYKKSPFISGIDKDSKLPTRDGTKGSLRNQLTTEDAIDFLSKSPSSPYMSKKWRRNSAFLNQERSQWAVNLPNKKSPISLDLDKDSKPPAYEKNANWIGKQLTHDAFNIPAMSPPPPYM